MRNARDTLLTYISTNLPGITVTNVRRDSKNPAAEQLSQDAVNLEFIYDRPGVQESGLQVSIDIIYADELQAIDVATSLWKLLGSTEIIPLMNYSAFPSPATPTGTMLRWNSHSVKFNKLVSDLFFRYNCHLFLLYSDPTMLA